MVPPVLSAPMRGSPESGRLAYPASRGSAVCTGASPHPRVSSCVAVEGIAMDITVDLPDEIGQWAKESGINLSQTLRAELEAERSRRDTVAGTLADSAEHKVHVAETGLDYVLHGALIAQDYDHEVEAYLGEDERIYVYDAGRQRLHEVDSPQDLGAWLADGLYVDAMRALGQKPILHLGQAR